MQKFTDSCTRNEMPYHYMPMYNNYPGYGSTYGGGYNNYNNHYGWYGSVGYQQDLGAMYQHYPTPQQMPYVTNEYHAGDTGDTAELNQLKRSLGCLNLVQTRKKDIDRYQ